MRPRLAVAVGLALVSLTALGAAAFLGWRAWSTTAALQGRLGGSVASVVAAAAARGATLDPSPDTTFGAFRRRYQLEQGVLLFLDLTADGRVRQLSLGHDRQAATLWEPTPDDWTPDQAAALARAWLPRDAAFVRREPFNFRDQAAGTREVYRSAAIARVFDEATYARFSATGPPGLIAITYYQTQAGSIALILVGPY